MSDEFLVNAEHRELIGKSASRRLRLADRVPGIIYGGDEAPMPITIEHKEIWHSLQNKAFYSHILSIVIKGKKHKALIKDLQRHPYKPRIVHVDFQRVSGKETLQRHVSLRFLNEETAPGVKLHGGIVAHHLRDVEVKCSVQSLPEYIDVDLGKLELDQALHLSDLVLPKGVEIVALSHGEEHDLPVVAIHLPRAAVDTAAEEAVAEAPAPEATTSEQK